jgi:phosphate starvation-inducible membrane PsiE
LDSSKIAHALTTAESIVLSLIAFVLVILAVVLLGTTVLGMGRDILQGSVASTGIEILNSILLVMMIMEIVYTVTKSLESHTLAAEPFLIIGAIAAIRRMLVITAESTTLELSNPDAFRSLLLELALLAAIVIAMSISVWILRKSGGDSKGTTEA